MGFEAELAAWATTQASLEAEDIGIARAVLLDSLGVMASGSRTPAARRLASVTEFHPSGRSPVLGTGTRTTPGAAALRNGTAGALELWDDTSLTMISHPSVPILAALLADEALATLNLGTFLRAFTVGIEIELAVARLVGDRMYERGFHSTGVLGVMGATAALANIRGLNALQMRNALGLAASMGSGLRSNFGSDVMGLHSGMAAARGVTAVELAGQGIGAEAHAITGRFGFIHAFGDQPPNHADWTGPEGLAAADIVLKRYPIGAPNVAPVAAALKIRDDMGGRVRDVVRIECRVDDWVSFTVTQQLPSEPAGGRVSLPYCVAAALTMGPDLAGAFVGEGTPPAGLLQLSRLISVETSDRKDAEGRATAEVSVITRGRVHRAEATASAYLQPTLVGTDGMDVRRKFRRAWGQDIRASAIETFVAEAAFTEPMASLVDTLGP